MATWNLFVLYNRKAKANSGDLIYTCPLIGYLLFRVLVRTDQNVCRVQLIIELILIYLPLLTLTARDHAD